MNKQSQVYLFIVLLWALFCFVFLFYVYLVVLGLFGFLFCFVLREHLEVLNDYS